MNERLEKAAAAVVNAAYGEAPELGDLIIDLGTALSEAQASDAALSQAPGGEDPKPTEAVTRSERVAEYEAEAREPRDVADLFEVPGGEEERGDHLALAADLATRLALQKPDEISQEDWAELRALMGQAKEDTDDLCVCGHVRHEHHTWNENATVGCAFCACQQFRLDAATSSGGDGEEERSTLITVRGHLERGEWGKAFAACEAALQDSGREQ